MDLTFQIAMQYCSLQHWTLLPSPVTSTTGCYFFLWLSLFILSGVISPLISPVVFWALIDLGSSSFSVLAFCLFILFIGFSGKNTEVVCPWVHRYLFIVTSYFSIVNSSIYLSILWRVADHLSICLFPQPHSVIKLCEVYRSL